MANDRIDLHYILVDILGSSNVYFQPPSTVQMKYPCIVYKRDAQNEVRANNDLYQMKKRYLVTVIDKNADSSIPDKMMQLQYCTFNNHFVADNLNHDVYSLYY